MLKPSTKVSRYRYSLRRSVRWSTLHCLFCSSGRCVSAQMGRTGLSTLVQYFAIAETNAASLCVPCGVANPRDTPVSLWLRGAVIRLAWHADPSPR